MLTNSSPISPASGPTSRPASPDPCRPTQMPSSMSARAPRSPTPTRRTDGARASRGRRDGDPAVRQCRLLLRRAVRGEAVAGRPSGSRLAPMPASRCRTVTRTGAFSCRGAKYEADVEVALLALADVDFAFVDCGANYGYWSVLVTSARFGGHSAVAIEAAPDTFAWLARNAAANGGQFEVLNSAIAERSGSTVTIRGAKTKARWMARRPTCRSSARSRRWRSMISSIAPSCARSVAW